MRPLNQVKLRCAVAAVPAVTILLLVSSSSSGGGVIVVRSIGVAVSVVCCVFQAGQLELDRPLLLFDGLEQAVRVALLAVVVEGVEVAQIDHVVRTHQLQVIPT